MPTPDKTRGVARRSLIYAVASILQKLSSLILLPVYTRLLTPEEYGYFNLIVTLLLLGGAIASLGMEYAVVRFCHPSFEAEDGVDGSGTALHRSQAKFYTAAYATVLSAAVALTVVLTLSGPLYSPLVFPEFDFYPVILVALASLLFQPLTTVYLALLQARSMARSFGLYSLALFVSNGALTVLFLGPLKLGLLGVALALVVANGSFALIGTVRAMRMGMLWVRFEQADARRLLAYALPMLPHTLTLQATSLATRVIISHLISVAAAGLFNIAMYAVNFIDAIQTAFHRAFLSWYFTQVDGKPPGWQSRVRGVIATFVGASVVISSSVALFASELLRLMTPESFHAAASIVPLLSLSMMVKSIYYPSLSSLLYHEKGTRAVLIISGTSSVISIPLAVLGAAQFGLMGVAAAQLVQRIMMSAMAVWSSRRLDTPGIPWSRVARLQSGGLVAVCFVMVGDHESWWGLEFWSVLFVKVLVWIVLVAYLLVCDPNLVKAARSVIRRESEEKAEVR
ncbi:lipopolysaccharide biosynthesis protein [Rhodococcus sp. DMF-1]|uniref:lipopolysaccharide biosynthesis protein n=1 Tax=Rhodococcus TaxID=1827 RepID=UPI00029B1119|nr:MULTISPECIES: lipopolysaccharide biosynthesis protein [Rhodococcus]MDO2377537.1 lipopolysaccharide biosynthesis protein [Rhodococcus ruber]UIR34944.1 lipopolysaccharide biosynthesis protein [Rhodococcus sp. DMF-1]